jgi:transposase
MGCLQALLPGTSCLKLNSVEQDDTGRIQIAAVSSNSGACCPGCNGVSTSLHSTYSRVLRDLPWHGFKVEIDVRVRRFRCRASNCSRRTFAETLPLVSCRYGRQTSRLSETIRLIGYALGGEAGARLAQRLGMETSGDTVLRRVKSGPVPPVERTVAVGVDDWAWRKGQRYGTILVDLDKHVPVDLLPDRSADSLAAWLQSHPGVVVISRDRSSLYAEGAARGASEAIQVADRFHLVCNLTSAMERVLDRKRTELAQAVEPITTAPVLAESAPPVKIKSKAEEIRDARRQCRMDRYHQVVELFRQGMSQREISGTLHIERKTIRSFLRAGQFPERATPHRKPPQVNAFADFLNRRWKEGCHNATALWREIQTQGYTGGRSMVAQFVAHLRTQGTKYFRKLTCTRPNPKPPSPRQVAMLLARRPETLKDDEQQLLSKLNEGCPEISTLQALAQGFAAVFRSKRSEGLNEWITEVSKAGLTEIARFCKGLACDADAVNAAVTLPWSNGQVEGQVNRLKLVKRQMYGRASFQLLRCRVLPYFASPIALSAPRAP